MQWEVQLARMEEKRNAFLVLVEKRKERVKSEDQAVDRRIVLN
jgi:hypothetical protein